MAVDAGTFTVDAKDLAHQMTITVHLARLTRFRWRVKIAGWLMRLAAWVMWTNIDIEMEQ